MCSPTAPIARPRSRLKARGFRSRIHRRAHRNHPLSDAQTRANRAKSRIRARIEHVFGAQQVSAGGRIVRTIGIVRARAKIGLQNFAYNIRRLMTLDRMAAALGGVCPQRPNGPAGRQSKPASATDHARNRFSIRPGDQIRAVNVIVRGALMVRRSAGLTTRHGSRAY